VRSAADNAAPGHIHWEDQREYLLPKSLEVRLVLATFPGYLLEHASHQILLDTSR
jgi:hypothetical protein